MIMRKNAASGCLLLLCTAVSAQQQTPSSQTPPGQPAQMQIPAQPPTLPTQPPIKPQELQPGMLQPVPGQPGMLQPVPSRSGLMLGPAPTRPDLLPPAPPAVSPTTIVTTPAPLPLPVPATVPKPDESLGTDLHRKIREDERHFREQHDAAKRDFELRQTEEKKLFSATLEGKGFWERNRMKRQFRETQNLKRKEFDAEQDKKRRTYEWRYP